MALRRCLLEQIELILPSRQEQQAVASRQMNGFYQTGQAFVQTGHAVHRFVRGCEKVNTLEGVVFGHIWEGQ